MPYADPPSRLHGLLHRRGISRRVNGTYAGRWVQCTVDTVLPWRWLANVANRWETPHLRSRQRVSRWVWRWVWRDR